MGPEQHTNPEEWRSHPKAQQAVDFFQNLTLIGDYSGEKWKLDDWQDDWIRELYGRRNPDGSRQINKVSLWMPRGAGKTQQAAGLALYDLVVGLPGREVFAGAPDRDKASRLYKAMAQMVRADKFLSKICKLSDHYLRIQVKSKSSEFRALAADDDQGHGLAPSTLILDELHLWKKRDLYDALTSGGHKRKSGSLLEVQISTAGNKKSGLAWELYSYAKDVKEGKIHDPATLVRIFEAPESDDWTAEETWRKAMPWTFCNFDVIRKECELAKHIKHKEFAFRQLYLGQWIEQTDEAWIQPAEWDACFEAYTEADLFGHKCCAALDLSNTKDLTSLSLWFPDSKRVLSYSWKPSIGLAEAEIKDQTSYRAWKRDGWLRTTTTNRIVHPEVADDVNAILAKFKIEAFVMDPFAKVNIKGFLKPEPSDYLQRPGYMSPPMRWLETAIAQRTIRHHGNPLLSWAIANVVPEKDKFENISPSKSKARKRIDPCVSLIMAIGAWLGGKKDVDLNAMYANPANWTLTK